jgi:hypothetical protein
LQGCLESGHLTALVERTTGLASLRIGLIDGPVETSHSEFAGNIETALKTASRPYARTELWSQVSFRQEGGRWRPPSVRNALCWCGPFLVKGAVQLAICQEQTRWNWRRPAAIVWMLAHG